MSRLQAHRQVQAGEYDFANDPTGGAVGVALLQVYIPQNSMVTGFWVDPLTAFLSPGAATISFGFVGSPIAFMVATPFGAFVPGTPMVGVDLNVAPLKMNPLLFPVTAFQVTMSIGVAVITAGRCPFVIEYAEKDV